MWVLQQNWISHLCIYAFLQLDIPTDKFIWSPKNMEMMLQPWGDVSIFKTPRQEWCLKAVFELQDCSRQWTLTVLRWTVQNTEFVATDQQYRRCMKDLTMNDFEIFAKTADTCAMKKAAVDLNRLDMIEYMNSDRFLSETHPPTGIMRVVS